MTTKKKKTDRIWREAFWTAPAAEEDTDFGEDWDDFVPLPSWMTETPNIPEQPAELVLPEDEQLAISIESDDMDTLRRRAEGLGLSCEALAASIMHRYLNGTLVDIDEARKLLTIIPSTAAG